MGLLAKKLVLGKANACPPVARDRDAHWNSAWLAWVIDASPIYPSRGDERPSCCSFMGVVTRPLSTVIAPSPLRFPISLVGSGTSSSGYACGGDAPLHVVVSDVSEDACVSSSLLSFRTCILCRGCSSGPDG
jgi:hypothetical protein